MGIMNPPTIAGFTILGFLRQGALGPVWKAKELAQNRIVELQTLPMDFVQAPERQESFRKRIVTLASLQHSHIAKLYDGNVYGDLFYLVAEYVGDTSLSAWLSKDTPEENIPAIAEAVASALDYAWNTINLTHGALTPESIRVTDDGVLKLTDLGLSEFADASRQPDVRNDIYSLGVILQRALRGKKEESELSRQLDLLIRKMTDDSSHRRYADWQNVLAYLRRIRIPHIPPKPPTPNRRNWKWDEDEPPRKVLYKPADSVRRRAMRKTDTSLGVAPVLILALFIAAIGAGVLFIRHRLATKETLEPVSPPVQQNEVEEPVFEEPEVFPTDTVQTVVAPLPAAPPTMADFDALTNRAEGAGEILWQVGKLNGLPRDGMDKLVESEYSNVSVDGEVVHIRKPEDFAQILASKQTFVVHVGKLKYGDGILKLAVNSARPFAGVAPCDYDNRRVQMLWNNTCVWWRWIPNGHTIMEVFLPGDQIEPEENLLTIQNEGQESLCLDALWIESLKPGPRMFAALESGNAIGRNPAAYAPVCLIKLPTPPAGTGTLDRTSMESLPKRKRPSSAAEAVAEWKTLQEEAGAGSLLEDSQKATDKLWQGEIFKALQRGMLPVVETGVQGTNDVWSLWAQRYGAFVGHWVLDGAASEAGEVEALLRQRIPDVAIMRAGSPDPDDHEAETENLLVSQNCSYWGGRMDSILGQRRLTSWSTGRSRREPPDDGLRLAPCFILWADVLFQRKHAAMLTEGMMQWWMAGGNKVVVAGAEPGDVFFPDGSGIPATSWNAARLLLNFGNGSAQRSICNVVCRDRNGALGDTYWAAACDSTQSVSVALFSGERDPDREAQVSVPVPWMGRTRCVIDSVRLHERKADPEILARKVSELDIAPELLGEKRFARKSATGYAQFPIKLASVQLARLTPEAGRDIQRRIHLEDAREKSKPPLVQGLFQLSAKPLPADRRIIPLRAADGLAEALSVRDSRKVTEATVGSFSTCDLRPGAIASQTVEVRNVAPWEPRSIWVAPGRRGDSNDAPSAVRLYWDAGRLAEAQTDAFWVRATLTLSKSGSLPGRSEASFLMGTCEKRERLVVKPDRWGLFVFRIESLRNRDGGLPSYLTVWSDPEIASGIGLEFNGFVGLSDQDEKGQELSPVRAQMRLNEKESELLIALYGESGRPAYWHGRLPDPVEIEKVTLSDDSAVMCGLAKKGEQAEGDIGCRYEYNKKSQVLQVAIVSFPAASSPSVLSAQQAFPGLAPLLEKGTNGASRAMNSVVVLRCRVRR
jgi:hypothetical protein